MNVAQALFYPCQVGGVYEKTVRKLHRHCSIHAWSVVSMEIVRKLHRHCFIHARSEVSMETARMLHRNCFIHARSVASMETVRILQRHWFSPCQIGREYKILLESCRGTVLSMLGRW